MKSTPSTCTESAREIPVLGAYDVAVCGGGPAGCAAAVAAARHGARTLLIEKDGYLGGATVSQLVCVVLSTNGVDFQGIWHDYARALLRRNGMTPTLAGVGSGLIRGAVDPEMVKYAWDELTVAAGVTLLHHAGAARAIVEGTSPDGVPCAAGVFVETKAGRRAVLARCVIDATGDGIVAAQSGVPWEQGDGLHPYAMACTKVFRMGNAFWPGNWPEEAAMEKVAKGLAAAVRQGDYDSPVITEQNRLLGYVRGRHWELPEHRHETLSVISRVLAVDPLDPFDLTRAEREGREQARQAVDVYRRHVPGFERAFLADTSAHLGVRSSRRLHGLATVTAEDAIRFRKHPDAIARSSWEIDVWPADSYTAPAVDRSTPEWRHRRDRLIAGEFFDIRYGCLVATGLDNLLMAGRCLSAEHLAQASLRIQQTCMATGEAAGVAAALSVRAGVPPRALDPLAVAAAVRADCAAVEPAFECLRNLPTAGRHGGASP